MDFKLNKSNLNFRVYTADPAPATGRGNDICVISDSPMKNWILSPNNPSGAPRSAGDVWIQYAAEGDTFDALKTNSLMIAPLFAYQYIDNQWVEKDFKIFHNGSWYSKFDGVFYNNGVKGTNLAFNTNNVIQVREEEGYLHFNLSANTEGRAFVSKKYSLTPYKKLTITWNSLSSGGYIGAIVYKDGNQVKSELSSQTSGTISIDISALSGMHDVGVKMYSETPSRTARVTYFALEK